MSILQKFTLTPGESISFKPPIVNNCLLYIKNLSRDFVLNHAVMQSIHIIEYTKGYNIYHIPYCSAYDMTIECMPDVATKYDIEFEYDIMCLPSDLYYNINDININNSHSAVQHRQVTIVSPSSQYMMGRLHNRDLVHMIIYAPYMPSNELGVVCNGTMTIFTQHQSGYWYGTIKPSHTFSIVCKGYNTKIKTHMIITTCDVNSLAESHKKDPIEEFVTKWTSS